MNVAKQLFNIIFFTLLCQSVIAQTGTVRGFIYDSESGEPLMFTTVFLKGTSFGTATGDDGFYAITKVPPGNYSLSISSIEYDSTSMEIIVKADNITTQSIYLNKRTVQIGQVNISAEREEAKTEVKISTIKIRPKDINKIPSIGGEPDLAQYLQILPGVIFTGDQGGQLYIRGGSPIQTKVLMDGVTIYNPFHSIGLFSVFETDILRSVDVYTGGFNAEYGGRISAVMDIKTKDGNKKRHAGKISGSPFMAKATLEGPLKKLDDKGSSITYLLNTKISYLDKTSPSLYSYVDSNGIPFSFSDFYGKISFNSSGGSKFNLFGFHYKDNASFQNLSNFRWTSLGVGSNFSVVPGQGKAVIGGTLGYSNYEVTLQEGDAAPRTSFVGGFNILLDFTYFINEGELKYGFEINGLKTVFKFQNSFDVLIDATENTTELGFFLKYKKIIKKKVIFEPSIRTQYYASLGIFSFEPRLGLKWNIADRFRVKFATGVYSQNLISGKSDRDVVNLFTSFLSDPEDLKNPDGTTPSHKLQKAVHVIGGIEYDITKGLMLSVEPYLKNFTQLINLNRNKLTNSDPNFVTETGKAYGIDFLTTYNYKKYSIWTTYSLGYVERNDGEQVYNPHYDRRHNINFVTSISWGKKPVWEASLRWNFGSGFPFTKTQAFYPDLGTNFVNGGVNTNYTTANSEDNELGVLFEEDLDGGRLPNYHRLDLSIKSTFSFSKNMRLDIIASISNVYNRENIFFFDRVQFDRVNQLPILPSLAATFSF